MKNISLIFKCLILIILCLVMFCFCDKKVENNIPKNSKIFHSERFGSFSLANLDAWTATESPQDDVCLVLILKAPHDKITTKLVVVLTRNHSQSLEMAAVSSQRDMEKIIPDFSFIERENLQIQDMKGIRSEYRYSLQGIYLRPIVYQIYAPSNDICYTLAFTIPEMNYERDIETVENIALSLRPRSQSDIIQEQSKNNYVKDFLDNKVCLIEDILDYFPEEATLLNANIDIKIDGQKAKCFEYYVKRDNTVSGKNVELEMYSITYNIIYKQYLILLQGMVNKNSVVNFDAKSTFEQYKPLFQLMANSLVITSK